MNYLGSIVSLIDSRSYRTLPWQSEGRHCRSSLRDDCVHTTGNLAYYRGFIAIPAINGYGLHNRPKAILQRKLRSLEHFV